jgi:hypothetical protein
MKASAKPERASAPAAPTGELGADEALVLFLGTPECLLGERAGPARLPQRDLH